MDCVEPRQAAWRRLGLLYFIVDVNRFFFNSCCRWRNSKAKIVVANKKLDLSFCKITVSKSWKKSQHKSPSLLWTFSVISSWSFSLYLRMVWMNMNEAQKLKIKVGNCRLSFTGWMAHKCKQHGAFAADSSSRDDSDRQSANDDDSIILLT